MSQQLQADNLLHDYGDGPILDIPHLALPPGYTHLAGPNGSGKTTLLRILATLQTPTRGQVTLLGHRLPEDAKEARSIIGYAGHRPSLHASFTPLEALSMHADLHDVSRSQAHASLEAWELAEQAGTRVAHLSHGQRRRLDLARALLHDPRIVLLDEPLTGLDEPARDVLIGELDKADPVLVVVAAPTAPELPVDATLELDEGRLVEAPA